jgi:hypothetical protein
LGDSGSFEEVIMDAKGLRSVIENLPNHGEYSQKLEAHPLLAINRNPTYKNQKDHWLRWLGDYDGPGFYERKTHSGRDAKYIYNHIMCSPMLLYLPEVLGVSIELIGNAYDAVIKANDPKMAKQCAIIRSIIPFELVEEYL